MWPFKKKKTYANACNKDWRCVNGVWYHIVLTEEMGELRVYLDGKLVFSSYKKSEPIKSPDTIHAVCSRCGKTDFKGNMESKDEAYIDEKYLMFDSFRDILMPSLVREAKIRTIYTHKNCRKRE